MSGLAAYFNWKVALIWHTTFCCFAMLQGLPILGMIWLIINAYVFILLLRAVYGPPDDEHSNRIMAWYCYTLSIFTDFISLCAYGQHIVNERGSAFLAEFVIIMAVFILIPKPIFSYFLSKSSQKDRLRRISRNSISAAEVPARLPDERINLSAFKYSLHISVSISCLIH